MSRTCMALLAAPILFLASGTAYGSSDYPAAIQNKLKLGYTPACTVCHVGGEGRGTVTAPFGVALMRRGLVAGSTASLDTAIDALDAEKTDSNGDGLSDIDALRAQKDPNEGAVVPAYGIQCDATAASGRPGPNLPWGYFAGLGHIGLAMLLRRFRRRPR